MLTLKPRKTVFAAAVAAAVSAAPVTLASLPANAADADDFPACAQLIGTPKALCAVRELDKRIEAERKSRAEAIREGREAERRTKIYNEQAAAAREQSAAAREQSAAAREQSAAAREQSATARKKMEEVKTVEACVDYLIAGMNSGIFKKQDILEKAGGLDKLKQGDTACVVAKRHFGYGKKAEAQPPLR